MRFKTLFKLLPTLFLAACVTATPPTLNNAERGILSTKMVNLSSAVDTYFADLPGAPADSDAIILQKSTQHDKRLMAPEFEHYVLKVQYQNPYAVLLLCSEDGKSAIMEDAGCSARLDRQVSHFTPCEFTLHVSQSCHVEGADPQ
jgi:hypothetical protein